MIKFVFSLCLFCTSMFVSADAMNYGSESCELIVNKLERLSCYDTHSSNDVDRIPFKKNKLTRDQKLIDTYRCGNRLIQAEKSLDEVSKICPRNHQPIDIEYYLETFEVYHYVYDVRYVSVETYEMEKWTFKKYGHFRTYVIFRDGLVYQIIQDRSIRD